ncbi:MAG: hypothetical protein ABL907_00210, partial [Hyphomicrobium sp.]
DGRSIVGVHVFRRAMANVAAVPAHAIERVKTLPPDVQEDAARTLIEFADRRAAAIIQLTDAQFAEVQTAKQQVRDGHVTDPKDIEKIWQRLGV